MCPLFGSVKDSIVYMHISLYACTCVYIFMTLLCVVQMVSLTLDGLTGMIQDQLRAKHSVTAHHMMYAVNAFSSIYLSVAVVATGEIWRVAEFILDHPEVLLNIAAFSFSSAIGQVIIILYIMIRGPWGPGDILYIMIRGGQVIYYI